jgi:hypothetical protein
LARAILVQIRHFPGDAGTLAPDAGKSGYDAAELRSAVLTGFSLAALDRDSIVAARRSHEGAAACCVLGDSSGASGAGGSGTSASRASPQR